MGPSVIRIWILCGVPCLAFYQAHRHPLSFRRSAVTGTTVEELKEQCRKLGLPVSGRKADLVQRLESLHGKVPEEPGPTSAGTPATQAPSTAGNVVGAAYRLFIAEAMAPEVSNMTNGALEVGPVRRLLKSLETPGLVPTLPPALMGALGVAAAQATKVPPTPRAALLMSVVGR